MAELNFWSWSETSHLVSCPILRDGHEEVDYYRVDPEKKLGSGERFVSTIRQAPDGAEYIHLGSLGTHKLSEYLRDQQTRDYLRLLDQRR